MLSLPLEACELSLIKAAAESYAGLHLRRTNTIEDLHQSVNRRVAGLAP
jgi:hypothetical protein